MYVIFPELNLDTVFRVEVVEISTSSFLTGISRQIYFFQSLGCGSVSLIAQQGKELLPLLESSHVIKAN